jgi:2-phospho-L-lactate/phosphoenolpyruvate guanylyltransferase
VSEITAVVPARRFDLAKSRLRTCLAPPARQLLAERLLTHVLGALSASCARPRIIVVTDGEHVAEAARRLGASVLLDPVAGRAPGLQGAVEAGLEAAGAGLRLVVMADLPCLTPADVDALLDALAATPAHARPADVAFAPDARGSDTNALALRPGASLRTFFGTGSSLGKHTDEATRTGLSAAFTRRPGLALDLDIEQDLDAARALGAASLAGLSADLPSSFC